MNFYVLAAIGLALLGMAGYGLYERGNAANARADAVQAVADLRSEKALREQFAQDLGESQADNQALREDGVRLDGLVKNRDARIVALTQEKRSIDEAHKALKARQSKEDQDCLNRALPPDYAGRLRDGAAAVNDHGDKDRAGQGAGNAHVPVR